MLRRRRLHPSIFIPARTFIDARVPWVRDRALDHAVEKEKHLLPFHNLKDFLIQSPSPLPLPLSSISPHHSSLSLPFRPIRFLRLFPSAFLESLPDHSPTHPHFSPSPSLLKIHEEEQLALSSTRSDAADRLLRLLMLCPRRRIPLRLVHHLSFDLGLPKDFPRSLLPDFPDYFQIVPARDRREGDLDLELVIYNNDLAVSEMERHAMKTGGYKKGAPLAFPLKFTRGFEMEKKVRKWVEEWQKLPYVSPYEVGSRLPARSDVWEKWAVGMVHELLSLMVPRKTVKGNLEMVARHVGLPAAFRRMILNHPGIFYVSNKLRTQTVVLREAYRRDLLVEKHPLMGLRYQYIHLMRKGKEGSGDGKKKNKKKAKRGGTREVDEFDDVDDDDEEDAQEDEDDEEGDEDGEISGVSDFDSEGEESYDEESDDEDVDYNASRKSAKQGPRGVQVEKNELRRPYAKASLVDRRHASNTRRNGVQRKNSVEGKSHGRSNSPRGKHRSQTRTRVFTRAGSEI